MGSTLLSTKVLVLAAHISNTSSFGNTVTVLPLAAAVAAVTFLVDSTGRETLASIAD